jgi:peptide/nickel transport system substrate-binding protein
VVFKIIPEYSTRLLELQSGEVDMMEAVLVADADQLRKTHPHINLVRRGYRSMDYLGWNLTNPLFADKKVRQALAMSVDVNDMIAKLLTSETGEAYARPSTGTITPELCGAYNDEVKPFTLDLDRARALFAEAGWTDSNGDGVLDKDGRPFEFKVMTNAENKRRGDAAIRLQSQFKNVGVVMNIEKIEFNAMTDRLKKRDFEAVIGGWSAGLFVDPTDMWHTDRPENPSEFNYTSYSNAAVDALIENGLQTPKPEEAGPVWKEMQAAIYDDQPYLFLWWMDEIVAIDGRFQNTEINLLSNYNHLWDWSVPADKVKYTR